MTVSADEFLRRFLLHTLPRGFVRILSLGFLAGPSRTAMLQLARQLLPQPTPARALLPSRNVRKIDRPVPSGQRWPCNRREIKIGEHVSAVHNRALADARRCGVASVKLPPLSPNLNAYAQRFVRTIKESCLERMILFGEGAGAGSSTRRR